MQFRTVAALFVAAVPIAVLAETTTITSTIVVTIAGECGACAAETASAELPFETVAVPEPTSAAVEEPLVSILPVVSPSVSLVDTVILPEPSASVAVEVPPFPISNSTVPALATGTGSSASDVPEATSEASPSIAPVESAPVSSAGKLGVSAFAGVAVFVAAFFL